eukprot:GEZU01036901.1.p1 GENE.GEZU01036901.1~~GEZU01036901.1.p1  ORF type:complete len:254 (-),score=54.32 GEZU01036901.1:43-804(-)
MVETIIHPTSKHTASIIFLHGLGGTGMKYEEMIRPLAAQLSHVKVILPNAPHRHVTLFGTTVPSWYDIKGISIDSPEDEVGIRESTSMVHELIEREIANGIPSNRIVVAGASQGGAIALYSGLTYQRGPLAGILGASTYLPLHKTFPAAMSDQILDTPLLMCHGNADFIVPYAYGQLSHMRIKAKHRNAEFKTYPGLGHDSNPQELADILEFFKRVLPPEPTTTVTSSSSSTAKATSTEATETPSGPSFQPLD